MPDLSFLVLLLLGVRIVLDLIAIANRGTPYQLEFGYFLVFTAVAVIVLIADAGYRWGWLASAIATYSLVAFFVSKRERQNGESAV